MSRRRDRKREKEHELAAQLDPSSSALQATLLERARTGFVALREVSVASVKRPRTLFRAAPLFIIVRVGLKSPDGFTSILTTAFDVPPAPGPATFSCGSHDLAEKIRVNHHRPAHFVVLTSMTTTAPTYEAVELWPTVAVDNGAMTNAGDAGWSRSLNRGAFPVSTSDAHRVASTMAVLAAAAGAKTSVSSLLSSADKKTEVAFEMLIDT